jgi:hypothetical protein
MKGRSLKLGTIATLLEVFLISAAGFAKYLGMYSSLFKELLASKLFKERAKMRSNS